MIKAVIFDLDGVIVSTDELHYNAWKTMTTDEGIHFDRVINHRLRGISRMESLDIVLDNSSKEYTLEEKNKLAEYKNLTYKKSLSTLDASCILPGIQDLLQKLKEENYLIAIGSSSKNAKAILDRIGYTKLFDAISDGTNINNSKPDPEVFVKAAQMLKVKNHECVVVEDAHSGIEAAKACGMLAFATGDAKTSLLKDFDLEELLEVLRMKKGETL